MTDTPLWYDRAGQPIDLDRWSELNALEAYKRVASTDVGPYWVSTVWLGLDHGMGMSELPLIFETMVFTTGERDDPEHVGLTHLDCRRYATEEQAHAGHDEVVTLVRATLQDEP